MCPDRKSVECTIFVDRSCSLPLKTEGVSATQSRNIRVGLTVEGGFQSSDRVSDQQNTLSPHGQRAYFEEAWVHPLDKIPKIRFKPYVEKLMNVSHLELEPKLPFNPHSLRR